MARTEFDVSIPDKDRDIVLIGDGQWHYLGIHAKPTDKVNTRSFAPEVYGPNDVAIEVYGPVHKGPGIWLRFMRYDKNGPTGDSTAWHYYEFPTGTGEWAFVHAFPFVIKPGQSVGVDYRLSGTATIRHRVIKIDHRA